MGLSTPTGLCYSRARYYHPGLQRFISEDPIRLRGGDVNLYAYAANRPIILRDPSGLKVYFFGFQASAALGGLGETSTGWAKEVTLGIAYDSSSRTFATFRTVGVTTPGNADPGDSVVGANLGLGSTMGVLDGDKADFFGEAREATANVGPFGLTETTTSSGRTGVAVSVAAGCCYAGTRMTTHTEEGLAPANIGLHLLERSQPGNGSVIPWGKPILSLAGRK